MTAMAVALFSATASAEEVIIRCSDNVQRGTLVLTKPPTMNCDDFNLVKGYVGSGISVGPNSRITEIVSAIESIQPAPKAQPVTEVTEAPSPDSGLDDFSRKNFPGQNRNEDWFSESKSSQCQGWTNLNDILSGKCGSVQVNMTR